MNEPTEGQIKEPRPPNCVCCEYMRVCDADRDNGQKIDYCPDPKYRQWLYSEPSSRIMIRRR